MKAGAQDPENVPHRSHPGDQQQTLHGQTKQTLGLQIVLTTDGYTCLLSVWSLVTVLVKSQKMLPAASKALLLFYLDRTKSIRLSSRHWGPLWSYTGITPNLLRSESGSGWTETEIAAYHENETKEFVMNCDVTGKIRRFMRIDGLKNVFWSFVTSII